MTAGPLDVDDDAIDAPLTRAERRRARKHSPVRELVEWILIIAGALIVAFALKTWVLQAFSIPSPSMVPTLVEQDRILVNKLSYSFGEVERGDVVVFERPKAAGTEPNINHLVKRVIGLPGETIESSNGRILINGEEIREPYLPPGTVTDGVQRTKIPPGQYWVMGDNRGNSSDSRVFGTIDHDIIVGRAFARVWPVGSINRL